MDDVEVVDLSVADDDIISVTCDDDFEDDDSLEIGIREKFRIEREIKKEKIDDYPNYNVITTHLPGKKILPSSTTDGHSTTSRNDPSSSQDKVKECVSGVTKTLASSSKAKEGISKEAGKDKDPEKNSDGYVNNAVKKNARRCFSSMPSTDRDSLRFGGQNGDETETRKRKQGTSRNTQRKRIFIPVNEGRNRAQNLEEKTDFLWRKMRRILHQNRQLYQMVEKLCVKLNDRTLLNQAAMNRVREDCFNSAPLLAQGSFQNHGSILENSSTGPAWSNQGAYNDHLYPTQRCDVQSRVVRSRLQGERTMYATPQDEYLAIGHESNHGAVRFLENPDRYSSVVPTDREDYCTPRINRGHPPVQEDTLVYHDDVALNQQQVVRNQMVSGPSRLEGRLCERIFAREAPLQHQQEQHRSLEASYPESCTRANYPGLYSEFQRFEQPPQREIVVKHRPEVDHFQFGGQNGLEMGAMHERRVVRRRPILCQRQQYRPPLSRGGESISHVVGMTNSTDTRQVEYQRNLYPLDARSVEVGSCTFNSLAVDSLGHNRYWQGGQFFDRRA